MGQITTGLYTSIIEKLHKSSFTASAFEVKTPDEGDTLVQVFFLDERRYTLQISKRSYEDQFTINYSPGTVYRNEKFNTKEFSEFIKFIPNWCETIERELKATNPALQELEKVKAELNRKLDEHVTDSSSHFTKEEIGEWEKKFTDLCKQFEEFQKKSAITESELSEVKQTLEQLKSSLSWSPKKTWLRSAGTRLFDLGGRIFNSPAGQKLLTDLSTKLLNPPHA